jgi:hydroxymethylglutaryl-CoA synthase
MAAILGFAGYVPRYRVRALEFARAWGSPGRADGERAVPAPDETVLTMARAAAEGALARASLSPGRLASVRLCTLSPPYAERSLAASLAHALGAPPAALPVDHGLSARGAALALLSCDGAGPHLVAGADALAGAPGSPFEAAAGAGAGAAVVGPGPGFARLEGSRSHSTDLAERWRPSGEAYPRQADERFARTHGYLEPVAAAVKGLLETVGRRPAEYAHLFLQAPQPRWAVEAAKGLGFPKERLRDPSAETGDAGCGSFLLGLAAALEGAKAGERVLAVSFGSGGADALSLVVEGDPGTTLSRAPTVEALLREKEPVDYVTALRYRKVLKKGGGE